MTSIFGWLLRTSLSGTGCTEIQSRIVIIELTLCVLGGLVWDCMSTVVKLCIHVLHNRPLGSCTLKAPIAALDCSVM